MRDLARAILYWRCRWPRAIAEAGPIPYTSSPPPNAECVQTVPHRAPAPRSNPFRDCAIFVVEALKRGAAVETQVDACGRDGAVPVRRRRSRGITIDASRLTVLVTGNFVTGDAAAFQAKIAPLAGNFVVQFRSDGGLVFEALPSGSWLQPLRCGVPSSMPPVLLF
jgi:hypothetical protein